MSKPVTRYVEDGGRVEDDGRITFSEAAYDALAQRLKEVEALARKFVSCFTTDEHIEHMERGTQIALEELQAFLAEPAAPASQGWTATRPTVDGWYWYKTASYPEPYTVRVFYVREKLWGETSGYTRKMEEYSGGEWAGPIQPPREEG